MAGLRKAKEYDWKDSNLALFGSDLEKSVKKESAQGEPAWKGAGQKPGLQIWRIVNFKVTNWPKSDYGKFYNGDSYIVLNTYQEESSKALLHDVHFWIGSHSTQDEYGTAAYKTVELDTFLDDVPIQHREVQNFESELFRTYFSTIELLEGGADSGFNKVKPTEYAPRLLHFHGDRFGVCIKEVARSPQSLDSGDVFILDLGLKVIQWNGEGSNKDERLKAMSYTRMLNEQRSGKVRVEVVDENQGTEDFDQYLTEEAHQEVKVTAKGDQPKQLYRLSDESGKMTFSLEKEKDIRKSDLDSKDVFILDTKSELFVWIGNGTSTSEKKNAMAYAHNYLQKNANPFLPVTCFKEGRTSPAFESALAA